jgi:hypothetical protein
LQLIHDSEPSGQLLFLVQKQLPDSVLQTLMLARLLYKFTKNTSHYIHRFSNITNIIIARPVIRICSNEWGRMQPYRPGYFGPPQAAGSKSSRSPSCWAGSLSTVFAASVGSAHQPVPCCTIQILLCVLYLHLLHEYAWGTVLWDASHMKWLIYGHIGVRAR